MVFQTQLSLQKLPFFSPSLPILHAAQVVILKSSTSTYLLCYNNASKDASVIWERRALLIEEMEENSQDMSCLKKKKIC